ncbi:MAG TPA: histidine phosphatase family protein [Gemmatimonadaceae bacterium]|nr:histidine phosphatase family protein [Gemmatimonadaceae bacterium]
MDHTPLDRKYGGANLPMDHDLTSRLLLVRHGRSSHVHDGRWLTHETVGEFEDAYDAEGIRDDSVPSEKLLAVARDALVVASDLRRAIASAERLADGRPVVTSPLLREIRLEPPHWLPVALPIGVWDKFSYWQWSYRLRVGSDHEFVRRANDATAWLRLQLESSATIVVVTHGGFRRILAARLVAGGWRWLSTSPGGRYDHWSSWEFANRA